MKTLVPVGVIERKIYLIRGEKVMLSSDLAQLYGVEPKVLIQAVKRNIVNGSRKISCFNGLHQSRLKINFIEFL